MTKALIFSFCLAFAFIGVSAQTPAWQPAPGHTQVPIWPGKPPDAQPVAAPEDETTAVTDEPVAGRPWVQVGKVSRPTMTVYSPKENNTGAAVVVFPGGGYWILAIDLEGTEVCDWLTSRGITCVLLKYRVPMAVRQPSRAAAEGRGGTRPCSPGEWIGRSAQSSRQSRFGGDGQQGFWIHPQRIRGEHHENTKRTRSEYEANTKAPAVHPACTRLADGLRVALG